MPKNDKQMEKFSCGCDKWYELKTGGFFLWEDIVEDPTILYKEYHSKDCKLKH